MSDMPLDDLERELTRAAWRMQPARRQRLPRRTTSLAAAAAVMLVALPAAWATGLLKSVFAPVKGEPGTYLVASGTTSRGERWRFTLSRGHPRPSHVPPPSQRTGRPVPRLLAPGARTRCWSLVVGPDPGLAVCADGAGKGSGRAHFTSVVARVSRRDGRRLLITSVPAHVKVVRIRFRSGRDLLVRPLAVDAARARRTGVPFDGAVVAVAFSASDNVEWVHPLRDAGGRRVLKSPVL